MGADQSGSDLRDSRLLHVVRASDIGKRRSY